MRIFFVANRHGDGGDARRAEPEGQQREAGSANGRHDAADTDCGRQLSLVKAQGFLGQTGACSGGRDVADADNGRRAVRRHRELSATSEAERSGRDIGNGTPEYVTGEWREIEPGLGGVAYGLPGWTHEPDIPRVAHNIENRVQRLKCLGNAVVPHQVYPILKAINEILSEGG